MKVQAEKYKGPLRHIEMNKRRPPTATVERREEPVGRSIDLFRTWTEKGALLILSLFTVVHLVIIEVERVGNGLFPVATHQAIVQPIKDRSTVSDQIQAPTEPAADPTPAEAAADPTAAEVAAETVNEASIYVKPSSDSTSGKRSNARKRTRILSSDYSRTSPALEARAGKFVAPFRLERGVIYTFTEENGIIRARPSPSVPSSWGNGPADVQR